MTKWLASVQTLDEAVLLHDAMPDILDMKNPSQGALGALTTAEVAEIVHWAKDRCQTSATVGDLPMDATVMIPAINAMAGTGVDYVKIGLFPCTHYEQWLTEMSVFLMTCSVPVIAVIFADKSPFQARQIVALKQAGFAGVMVDTAIKNGQHLCQHWPIAQLHQFAELAKTMGLLTGLAGALRYQDIALLKSVSADYLGFRSALCQQQQRTHQLAPHLAKRVQQAMHAEGQPLKTAI